MTSASRAATPALEALCTAEGRALVESLTPYDPITAMQRVEAARAQPAWSGRGDVVAAAATQARLRTRAAERFPGRPRWWTPDGLEQATRPVVAARHARRFVAADVTSVADLGCGAGSDALALAAAGLPVHAVDRDPDALWALAATAADWGLAVRTSCRDVTTDPGPWNDPVPPPGMGCFVDPARRSERGRTQAPQSWSPPWAWVCALAGRVPATGAKVAPGIAHAELPPDTQTDWVSVGGVLLEAGVWWGPLRLGTATRLATVLTAAGPSEAPTEAHRVTILDDDGGIPTPPVGPVGGWLVEPDPAVIRAGLVSVLAERFGGRLLDPRIAYITTDTAPPDDIPGTAFSVVAELPFARRAMRAWLRARGYGDVVVKKRGINVIPEELRTQLRLGGGGPTATLVLTRTDGGPMALLVERQPSSPTW